VNKVQRALKASLDHRVSLDHRASLAHRVKKDLLVLWEHRVFLALTGNKDQLDL